MINRSAKRRLRQAINRANQMVSREDCDDGAHDPKNDGGTDEPWPIDSINKPKYRLQEASGAKQPTERREPNHLDARIANATVAMAVLTGLLFLTGVASAVIANRTLNIINGQLAEMTTIPHLIRERS